MRKNMEDNKLAIVYDNFDLQLRSCEKVTCVHIDDDLTMREAEEMNMTAK